MYGSFADFGSCNPHRKPARKKKIGQHSRRRHKMKGRFHGKPDDGRRRQDNSPASMGECLKFHGQW